MMQSLSTEEKRVIALALAVKAVVAVVMVLLFYQLSDFDHVVNDWNRFYTGADAPSTWYLPFANWDGQHYLLLSERGYHANRLSQAFFPLYPMLIRALGVVFSPPLAALLLSLVCTAGFCLFIYRIAVHLGATNPHLAALMVLTFPTAFYTSAVYSESLFLFLMTGFIYHLWVTRSHARLVYLFLLPLTRGTAAFVVGGLLLYAALDYYQCRAAAAKTKIAKPHRRKQKIRVPQPAFDWVYHMHTVLAFAAGVAAYLLFYYLITGDALSGLKAQQLFIAENRIANLFNPLNFFTNLLAPVNGLFIPQYALFDRAVMALFVAGIAVFVVRREWALLCFYLPLVYAHIAMGPSAMSYSRLILPALPFLAIALAKNPRHPAALYTWCAAAFALQLYLACRFSLNLWVG